MRELLLALSILILPGAATAQWDCRIGKTADPIYPDTEPETWGPASSSFYGQSTGIWSDVDGDALGLTGSVTTCIDWGGFTAGLTIAKDIDTYFELTSEHGCVRSTCAANQCMVNSVCRDSYEYHDGQAGIGPNSSGVTTIQRAQIFDEGDGVSINDNSTTVRLERSWLKFIHDDGVEDDFCGARTVVVDDNLLDFVLLAFAWDLRSGEPSPCDTSDKLWIVNDNLVLLHQFAHSYKEETPPGIFKDDGDGENPFLRYSMNVVLIPKSIHASGRAQLFFPHVDWIDSDVCENNVYLWEGTEADYDLMLAENGNEENRDAIEDEYPGCITEIKKWEVCPSGCTNAVFRATDHAVLDNNSWDDLKAAWITAHFPSGGGCGIGFELALVVPVIQWVWRRRRGWLT
jgi:hypothetical protein